MDRFSVRKVIAMDRDVHTGIFIHHTDTVGNDKCIQLQKGLRAGLRRARCAMLLHFGRMLLEQTTSAVYASIRETQQVLSININNINVDKIINLMAGKCTYSCTYLI